MQIDYIGQSREFMQASGDIYFTFVLALLFIYLVLAAQFESFIDPFIIMLTVPLSMTGALLALKLGGGTMNIYSQVGLVTLVGLITKNGILIVEFANQLQEQGRRKLEAVIEAAALRLRPILMTTAAMVLGAVPLGDGRWRRCGEPQPDRPRHRRRPGARDAADPVRNPDGLYASGAGPVRAARESRIGARHTRIRCRRSRLRDSSPHGTHVVSGASSVPRGAKTTFFGAGLCRSLTSSRRMTWGISETFSNVSSRSNSGAICSRGRRVTRSR